MPRARSAASCTSTSARRRSASAPSPRSRPDDYVVTTYRDHGIALAKGMSARALLAELFGKVTGCSQGLGGSMHMFDKEHNMLGGYGIVGGHIPLAAGVAFASKYRGDGRVTLCFFGEGAVSIGGFHEGLSLAALWKLPIVFICENNEYSMGTPLSRSMSRRGRLAQGARLRHGPRPLLRRRRARGRAAHRRGRPARAGAELADARRGPHLPLPRPLDERSGQVPHAGRARGAQEARPAPPRARKRLVEAGFGEPRARGAREVRRGGGRRRGQVRRREPGAGAPDARGRTPTAGPFAY